MCPLLCFSRASPPERADGKRPRPQVHGAGPRRDPPSESPAASLLARTDPAPIERRARPSLPAGVAIHHRRADLPQYPDAKIDAVPSDEPLPANHRVWSAELTLRPDIFP